MDNDDIKTKITIIDYKTDEKVVIPVNLSLTVTEMIIEDAIKSGMKVIVEPILYK